MKEITVVTECPVCDGPITPGQIKSWYGIITAGDGLLIGGIRMHVSSRFETQKNARDWAEMCAQENEEAGRDVDTVSVMPSIKKHEISEL